MAVDGNKTDGIVVSGKMFCPLPRLFFDTKICVVGTTVAVDVSCPPQKQDANLKGVVHLLLP